MCGSFGSTRTPADKRCSRPPTAASNDEAQPAARSLQFMLRERKTDMSFKLGSTGRRTSLTSALPPSLCMLVSACGGGGGSVGIASIPPPPVALTPPQAATPLTTIEGYSLKGSLDVHTGWLDSPATRAGTYDVIGR